MRRSALELLSHPWIRNALRTLARSESLSSASSASLKLLREAGVIEAAAPPPPASGSASAMRGGIRQPPQQQSGMQGARLGAVQHHSSASTVLGEEFGSFAMPSIGSTSVAATSGGATSGGGAPLPRQASTTTGTSGDLAAFADDEEEDDLGKAIAAKSGWKRASVSAPLQLKSTLPLTSPTPSSIPSSSPASVTPAATPTSSSSRPAQAVSGMTARLSAWQDEEDADDIGSSTAARAVKSVAASAAAPQSSSAAIPAPALQRAATPVPVPAAPPAAIPRGLSAWADNEEDDIAASATAAAAAAPSRSGKQAAPPAAAAARPLSLAVTPAVAPEPTMTRVDARVGTPKPSSSTSSAGVTGVLRPIVPGAGFGQPRPSPSPPAALTIGGGQPASRSGLAAWADDESEDVICGKGGSSGGASRSSPAAAASANQQAQLPTHRPVGTAHASITGHMVTPSIILGPHAASFSMADFAISGSGSTATTISSGGSGRTAPAAPPRPGADRDKEDDRTLADGLAAATRGLSAMDLQQRLSASKSGSGTGTHSSIVSRSQASAATRARLSNATGAAASSDSTAIPTPATAAPGDAAAAATAGGDAFDDFEMEAFDSSDFQRDAKGEAARVRRKLLATLLAQVTCKPIAGEQPPQAPTAAWARTLSQQQQQKQRLSKQPPHAPTSAAARRDVDVDLTLGDEAVDDVMRSVVGVFDSDIDGSSDHASPSDQHRQQYITSDRRDGKQLHPTNAAAAPPSRRHQQQQQPGSSAALRPVATQAMRMLRSEPGLRAWLVQNHGIPPLLDMVQPTHSSSSGGGSGSGSGSRGGGGTGDAQDADTDGCASESEPVAAAMACLWALRLLNTIAGSDDSIPATADERGDYAPGPSSSSAPSSSSSTSAAVDASVLESMVLIGCLPPILACDRPSNPAPLRLQAARFVRTLLRTSPLTLQALVTCGGFAELASLLQESKRPPALAAVDAAARPVQHGGGNAPSGREPRLSTGASSAITNGSAATRRSGSVFDADLHGDQFSDVNLDIGDGVGSDGGGAVPLSALSSVASTGPDDVDLDAQLLRLACCSGKAGDASAGAQQQQQLLTHALAVHWLLQDAACVRVATEGAAALLRLRAGHVTGNELRRLFSKAGYFDAMATCLRSTFLRLCTQAQPESTAAIAPAATAAGKVVPGAARPQLKGSTALLAAASTSAPHADATTDTGTGADKLPSPASGPLFSPDPREFVTLRPFASPTGHQRPAAAAGVPHAQPGPAVASPSVRHLSAADVPVSPQPLHLGRLAAACVGNLQRGCDVCTAFAQGDGAIKTALASPSLAATLLRMVRPAPYTLLHHPAYRLAVVRMLRAVKWLSMEPAVVRVLHEAGAIGVLTPFLAREVGAGAGNATAVAGSTAVDGGADGLGSGAAERGSTEVASTVLFTIFNLCRVSRERQAAAAGAGIVPVLSAILASPRLSILEPMAVPLLCDLAHAGQQALKALAEADGAKLYVRMLHLGQVHWHAPALNALASWVVAASQVQAAAGLLSLAASTPTVASGSAPSPPSPQAAAAPSALLASSIGTTLSSPSSIETLTVLFTARAASSEALLGPFTNITERCMPVATAFAQATGCPVAAHACKQLASETRAVLLKGLVSLLNAIYGAAVMCSGNAAPRSADATLAERLVRDNGLVQVLQDVKSRHSDKVVVMVQAQNLLDRLVQSAHSSASARLRPGAT